MSEMLKRVTDAIKAEFGKAFDAKPLTPGGMESHGDWFATGDPGTIDLERLARAAIEAMREPTAAMRQAGVDARWQSAIRDANNVREIWHAMIDEAIK